MSLKNWDNKTWLSSTSYIKSFNNFLLKQIKLNKNSQILDIGCGRGKILGTLSSKLSLKNDQKISIYAHYSTPMTITTGEISSFKRMDISYMKKVNKRFNFTIKLKDIFDTSGFLL